MISDSSVYKEIKVTEKDLVDLVDKSNKIFANLERRNTIQEKEKNYFKFNFKKATNVGKFYLLPKIYKSLSKAPGRPVISNCGMPTEKISEFLDHHLKPLLKQGESHVKGTGNFLEKLERVEGIPKGAILVTADVVGLHPSIPYDGGLKILRKQYDKFKDKMVPTEDIIKMADFVLKNNLFEFDCKFYQQISGTAIGTKFAPPYACIFMDFIETKFLKTQAMKPWLWKRFIDDIFLIWTDSEKNLNKFLKDLNEFHPYLRFTYEKSKEKINFLDLVIKLTDGKIVTDLYCKSTDSHQYLHYDSCHAEHIKRSIIFSQALRLKRICSQKSDLNSHVKELKNWFSKRGYPDRIISEQVNRALRSEENVKERDGKHYERKWRTIIYNPNFKNLRILIRKNLQFLYADPETKSFYASTFCLLPTC